MPSATTPHGALTPRREPGATRGGEGSLLAKTPEIRIARPSLCAPHLARHSRGRKNCGKTGAASSTRYATLLQQSAKSRHCLAEASRRLPCARANAMLPTRPVRSLAKNCVVAPRAVAVRSPTPMPCGVARGGAGSGRVGDSLRFGVRSCHVVRSCSRGVGRPRASRRAFVVKLPRT